MVVPLGAMMLTRSWTARIASSGRRVGAQSASVVRPVVHQSTSIATGAGSRSCGARPRYARGRQATRRFSSPRRHLRMCGRFTLRTPPHALAKAFQLEGVPDLPPRYNIAPTQDVAVVRPDTHQRELSLLRWGLVPFWADDPKIGYSTINARAETVATKPSFREAFKKRRCLVVADGFYEWQKTEGAKQPTWPFFPSPGTAVCPTIVARLTV